MPAGARSVDDLGGNAFTSSSDLRSTHDERCDPPSDRCAPLGVATAAPAQPVRARARIRVSSRHLSFVERGRSRPSAEVVINLAEQLEVPLRDRNHLLLAAGYAPPTPSAISGHPTWSRCATRSSRCCGPTSPIRRPDRPARRAHRLPSRRTGPRPRSCVRRHPVPLRLSHGDSQLAFISTETTFGTAVDVTVAELSIESFFPADRETAEAVRALL
jgi:hypothetical protein